jgi:hypothetical protein
MDRVGFEPTTSALFEDRSILYLKRGQEKKNTTRTVPISKERTIGTVIAGAYNSILGLLL